MNKRLEWGVAGLCVALAPFAAAADDDVAAPSTNLPPVVVEASRNGRTALEMPLRVEVVTRERVAASGAQDLPDLLQRETGVFVRHLAGDNPALAQFALRGYGENSHGRTLVVVDGERIDNPDMSSPNLARIPLEGVDRVEVLHGPQTVLHGSGANAGLVNVVSETPNYERRTYVQGAAGSWDTCSLAAGTRGGFADERVAYWANGAYKHSDGYRDHSGYDVWNAAGGARKDWKNGSWLKLSSFYSDSEYDLPGGLTRAQWHADRRASVKPEDRARFYTYGGSLAGYGVVNDENALRLALTASQRRTRSFYHNDLGGGYVYDEHLLADVYSVSAVPQYEWNGNVCGFDDRFVLGGDFRFDKLIGSDDYTGSYAAHDKPVQERFTMGGFAQNEFFFTDEISFVLGARLARSMARNERATKAARNDNLHALEAALNYRPVDEAKIFAKWSRFYRNPFLDETPWYYTSSGSYLAKGILAPERGHSVDVGGDWEFLDDFTFGGALFAAETKDEIFYDAGRGANVNSPDAVLREGFESHLGWNRDKVAGVNLRYALTHAEFTEGAYDGERVPLVPAHQIRLDGRVWLWSEFSVRGGYRYVSNQVSCSDFANVYDRIPGFGLFDLGCRYEPACSWLKGFTFDFTIDNLFDRDFCDYSTYGSSYYPGAGRFYALSVRYEF